MVRYFTKKNLKKTCNAIFHKNVVYVSLHFCCVTSICQPDVGPERLKNVTCL